MVSEPAQNDIDSKFGQIALTMMIVRSPRRRRRLGGEVIKWKAGPCTSSRVASSPLEVCVRDGAPDRREDPATSSETRVGRDRAGLARPDAAARVALRL